MKNYFVILMLFVLSVGFAQLKVTPIDFTPKDTLVLQPRTFSTIDWKPKISFNAISFYSQYDLSVYNSTSGFNDNYMLYNGKAEYINTQYVDHNGIFNNKLDSFNPNASTEMGGALINGVCNMLLDLIQK